jgi:uncharacterized protein YecT (DUF1311 family)
MKPPPNAPLTSISFEGQGKFLRLSTPEKWERAIRNGDLTPDTMVEVDRGGALETQRAGEVPELAAYLPQVPLAVMVDPPPIASPSESAPTENVRAAETEVEGPAESDSENAMGAEDAHESPAGISASAAEQPIHSGPRPTRQSPGRWRGLAAIVVILVVIIAASSLLHRLPTPNAAPSVALATPPAALPNPEPLDKMVAWSVDSDGDPKTYAIGGWSLTLSSRRGADGSVAPVLDVKTDTGVAFEQIGQSTSSSAAANFGVGKFDPTSQSNQILFTSFSGGAHCCTEIKVLELIDGVWTSIDIGSFEGEIDQFPTATAADGSAAIVETDDRFAYTFASFAESYLPPRVFTIVKGAMVDASQDPHFAKLYRADMRAGEKSCLEHNNGGCAAFVADASRVGLHDWAWQIMLSNFNPNSDWVLPTKCLIAMVNNTCPADQVQKFDTFPEALDWFLNSTGYITTAPVQAQDTASQTSPSFDCTRARAENLKLVCNTPELAADDRALALAYNEALVRSADRLTLQNDEQVWIARRSNTPADVGALKTLYEHRIGELRAPLPQ